MDNVVFSCNTLKYDGDCAATFSTAKTTNIGTVMATTRAEGNAAAICTYTSTAAAILSSRGMW